MPCGIDREPGDPDDVPVRVERDSADGVEVTEQGLSVGELGALATW